MTRDSVGPIVVATGNKFKLAELKTAAADYGLELISPAECRERFSLPPPPDVEEDKTTFAENAFLKADAFLKWSGIASLGDDSGLEVDALDGRPGIYSARYAGEGASDADKIKKLLGELEGVLNRGAQFRCALSLVLPGGGVFQSEGILRGHILEAPRGNKGFGYDPIVYLDVIGATLAEIEFERTCREGFRALAAQKLFRKI